jgi:hypothetical protein
MTVSEQTFRQVALEDPTVESHYDHGVVHLAGLPGVTIDLDTLFE